MAVKPYLNGTDLDRINGDIKPTQWQSKEEKQIQEQTQSRIRYLNYEISRLNLRITELEKQIQEYEIMKGTLQEVLNFLEEAKNGTINLQQLIPAAYMGKNSGTFVKSVESSYNNIRQNIVKINYIISDINKIIYDLRESIEDMEKRIRTLKNELYGLK